MIITREKIPCSKIELDFNIHDLNPIHYRMIASQHASPPLSLTLHPSFPLPAQPPYLAYRQIEGARLCICQAVIRQFMSIHVNLCHVMTCNVKS